MNRTAYIQGYLEKSSAPRWIREFQKGNLSMDRVGGIASRLGLKPRHLKYLPERGIEGVVSLSTHPAGPGGLAAAKIYDPAGPLFSRDTLAAKLRIHKAFKNDPRMSRFLGKKRGVPVTYHEFVRDNYTVPTDISKLVADIQAKGLGKIGDLHSDNILAEKVIDFLPDVNKLASTPYHKISNFHKALIGKFDNHINMASITEDSARYKRLKALKDKLNRRYDRRVSGMADYYPEIKDTVLRAFGSKSQLPYTVKGNPAASLSSKRTYNELFFPGARSILEGAAAV